MTWLARIFGHPRGLFVLFFTEMWERFSFYGMRALLVLYMTQYLFLRVESGETVHGFAAIKSFLESMSGPLSNQALSSQLYGYYIGLVYFTPFFGGLLADRYLGHRRSIYLGGAFMAFGHFMMAFESLFFFALLAIIVGNGFFKPNISTQIGTLYAPGDARRDRAFTIFYMGINIGAFFSPLVCGTLGQRYGWHYGFGAAGVGMMIGLLIYHFGRNDLPVEAPIVPRTATSHLTDEKMSRHDYLRLVALTFICALTILFWIVYEQQGNTLQLWSDKNVNWNILGFEMPSTWFQSLNPLLIFILAPLLDIFWNWQAKRRQEPSSILKMGLSFFMIAAAFLFMYFVANILLVGDVKINFMWIVLGVGIFTLAELYLSPIGLSLVTKMSPAKNVSMMMGVWFLASFIGGSLSGTVGAYYEVLGEDKFFLLLTAIGIGGGVIFLLAYRPLNRLIPATGKLVGAASLDETAQSQHS